MALYFPPLFCGQGTTLKARQDFDVEFDEGYTVTITVGDRCIVDDIIGYGYNIKKETMDKEFRIMNSSMPDFFDIIDKVEPEYDLGNFDYKDNQGRIITLRKDFEIKDIVKISKGQSFLHFVDTRKDGVFHDLFSIDNKAKILRMKTRNLKSILKNEAYR